MNENPQSILIVDDIPANLLLLSGMLKERGYRVRPVTDSEEALQAAQRVPPDLILLDVTMPGMNGYELCERMKADPTLKEIPVIFISALTDTIDKVRAFKAGGVDYMTKPFQIDEVSARVQTHLDLRRQKRALQGSYDRLKELDLLKDNLTNMIVHDMRSPLSSVVFALDFIKLDLPSNIAFFLKAARDNASLLIEMVNQLLDISRLEANQMPLNKTECELVPLCQRAIDSVSSLAGERRFSLLSAESVPAICDAELIRRVVSNLIGNAVKFTSTTGEISVSVMRDSSRVRVAVTDNGPGVPAEYHQKIFEKFGQVKGENKKLGTGLGLTFCKLAVEAHGGTIGVKSQPGEGSTFWFELPDAMADKPS
jgi:signal transduction histidine kinase